MNCGVVAYAGIIIIPRRINYSFNISTVEIVELLSAKGRVKRTATICY